MESKKEMRLLIFGPPGCGKGTLSKFIADSTQLTHISVGEIIRKHIAKEDYIGLKAKKLVSEGKLISDDVTDDMVQERLSQSDTSHSFLLDGYPRDLYQAKFLSTHTQLTGVILMTLSDDLIMKRLLARGRDDDTPKTIKNRIKLYQNTTKPVLDFLKEKNIPLIEINGDYDIKTAVDSIVNKIIHWQENI